MKSWVPTKEEWTNWDKLQRCGYVGFVVGIMGFILTCLSLVDLSKIYKEVGETNELLDKSTASITHIVPGDIEFNLKSYEEKSSTFLNASLIFQARKVPILLTKKVELINFRFDDQYLSYQDFERTLELKKVLINKVSIEKVSESAIINLEFDTMFVFVNPHDLVWNIDSIRGETIGEATIRIFYISNEREVSSDITMPIRFV
ncbi:hypothetical protein [Aliivibrio fischeri]|uniref:hypothetical protein n=1 Tax=Aliivibrio fischeri TaxID=668 RepID=UPI0012DA8232|nr:hypothetical protein [Aliivibrio fischeri]MUL11829.1 hypothetical protein [Aliivibrio fischeri]MUL15401.1 hypothetical protein [Aliivibrio fischeri]